MGSSLSCQVHQSNRKPKYYVGDVVYLKPDSLKCIIYYYGGNDDNPGYAVEYTDKCGARIKSGTGWSDSLYPEGMFY